MLCDDLNEWDGGDETEVQKGGDIRIHITELSFPGSSAGKESACIAGDPSSTPGLESSPGEG